MTVLKDNLLLEPLFKPHLLIKQGFLRFLWKVDNIYNKHPDWANVLFGASV